MTKHHDNMVGNNSHHKDSLLTLKNHDYRRNKHDEDYSDDKINRRVGGFTPKAQKLKPAGKCDAGVPWYFINGASEPEHVLTPADDATVRAHKLSCNSA